MVERKLVITGCGNCPFMEYVSGSMYSYGGNKCGKYNLSINYKLSIDDNKTHARCMLPINTKSVHLIKK